MKSHFSLILTLTACAVLLAACSWLGVSALNQRPAAISAAMFSGPTAEELAAALIRAGLDPEALAAANLDQENIAPVVEDVRAEMTDSPGASAGALASADADYTAAKKEHDRLGRLIRSGQSTQQDLTDYATAASDLSTATAARNSILNQLHDAGVATLGGTEQTLLATIRSNRSAGWDLPIQYLVVNREEEDWVALREALANERISAALGEDPDQDAQALIASVENNTHVSNAAINCDIALDFIESEWNDAVNGE